MGEMLSPDGQSMWGLDQQEIPGVTLVSRDHKAEMIAGDIGRREQLRLVIPAEINGGRGGAKT